MQYHHSVPDSQLKKNFNVNYFSKKECLFKFFKEKIQKFKKIYFFSFFSFFETEQNNK